MSHPDRMVLDVHDGLARLRLTRPEKRNAIDERFLEAFEDCVNRVSEDRRVRVMLLEAEGPSFSAGFDLEVLGQFPDEEERKRRFTPIMRERIRVLSRTLDRLVNMEPVTVAAIQGAAAGGGFSLALACDLRIAANDARCWYPEVELGSPLSPASTRILTRLVPAAVARDIILTCRRLNGQELLTLGLVNRIAEPSELADAAMTLTRTLLDKPAPALLTSKATINALLAGHTVIRTDTIRERE